MEFIGNDSVTLLILKIVEIKLFKSVHVYIVNTRIVDKEMRKTSTI